MNTVTSDKNLIVWDQNRNGSNIYVSSLNGNKFFLKEHYVNVFKQIANQLHEKQKTKFLKIWITACNKEIKTAKKRLIPMGVPEKNLKLGNALDSDAYNFDEADKEIAHDQNGLAVKVKDNIIDIEIVKFPRNITKKFTLKLSDPKLKIFLEAAVKKDFWLITNQELDIKFKNTVIMPRSRLKSLAEKNKFNSFDDFLKLNIDN